MPQDWTYYLAFFAGAAALTLYFRARRLGGRRNFSVLFAILVVVAFLLALG